ncbi:TonB-dependent siderophore receptor [Alysiella filiformis]|uniref:Iron complex outermembrane recepter protein n=1 Tax=Alysiella filiformis DSM 16848 TaxID=1120981 RepID=A0A286E285_9NEIS|nr:TonB-dependent siderophore receptor [Alysiella filiformis]QMT30865.1 TonB-dependent siderophore receptor [Alysiella filiformis]UBQ56150.1 TonB-dependent siderophore receptor [Alysiella filiformis DSM 16848]SOD65005.1 iron complex outermembrane recepter protein [Alysiella filiformis DSM 16848]
MKLNQITLSLLFAAMLPYTCADDVAQNLDEVHVRTKRVVNEKGYKAERTDITGVNTSILDTPYSIDVVTQKQLQDKQPENLEEAVKGVSGLNSGNNLAGTIDTIVRRGYGTNRDGSIMRNGMGSALARNLTATTERVEVLKGSASVLYGLQDAGGIVNVVTKKPNHQTRQSSLNISYGSYAHRQIGLDTTAPIGNTGLAYRFIADYKKKNSWRSFGQNTEYIIAPSLSWQNDTSKILASYEYQNYLGDFDRGTFLNTNSGSLNYLKAMNTPLKARLDDPINQTDGYSHTLQLTGKHKISPNWTAKTEYGFSKNHYSDWQARVVRHNAADEKAGVIRQRVDSTDPSNLRIHSFNTSLNGLLDQNENITHKFRASVQLQDYKLALGDLKRSNPFSVSLANLVNGSAYGSDEIKKNQAASTANAASSDMTEQYKTASLLLQNSAYLGDKWIVAGGVRAQYHKIHSGQGRGTAWFRNNDSGFNILPQFGAVYFIKPNVSLYGNWGMSAKPNPSRSWNYNGAKIELEKTQQFEIGSKYNGENISANIALFQINKKDTAKRYTDPISNEQVIRIAGKDRSRGVEIDVNGKITPKLEISANYTLTDTKVKQNLADPTEVGKAFDSVPKHMGGVLLNYDFGHAAGGNWRAGAGIDYRGSWGFNYNGNWVKMPSATTYNAFVSYDTKVKGKDLNLRLTGKNLGNKRYFTTHTTATMEHLQIANPREIGVSAKLNF